MSIASSTSRDIGDDHSMCPFLQPNSWLYCFYTVLSAPDVKGRFRNSRP